MGQKNISEGSLYGLDVGTRWRDASGRRTVVVLWVQRSGVVVYRDEGAASDDERVINILRFVETFVPANANMGNPAKGPQTPAGSSGVARGRARADGAAVTRAVQVPVECPGGAAPLGLERREDHEGIAIAAVVDWLLDGLTAFDEAWPMASASLPARSLARLSLAVTLRGCPFWLAPTCRSLPVLRRVRGGAPPVVVSGLPAPPFCVISCRACASIWLACAATARSCGDGSAGASAAERTVCALAMVSWGVRPGRSETGTSPPTA